MQPLIWLWFLSTTCRGGRQGKLLKAIKDALANWSGGGSPSGKAIASRVVILCMCRWTVDFP